MTPSSETLLTATAGNSAFSREVPGLQLAWDSTSLGNLKACARMYLYSNVLGYAPRETSAHLTFGIYYHGAFEHFDHYRAQGDEWDVALRKAIRWCLEVTWNRELGRPWISDIPEKNRVSLVRSVVWYLDQFRQDTLKTVLLADGRPAVELSFRFDLGKVSPEGVGYVVCGHFDKIVEWQEHLYIADKKTTKSALSPYYFSQFSPHNQFSLYTVASKVVYAKEVKGIIVDAAQIGAGFARFQRELVPRSREQNEEFLQELHWWIGHAEEAALTRQWPMNETACGNYGGCPFREVCSKSPKVREQWLERGFTRRVWDPLQTRGDI